MNILICDDMRNEAEELSALLEDSDFNVTTTVFCSGRDALNYLHTGAVIDVCFLDILMPEMSGVDLAQKLRHDGFAGSIIFLSNSNEYAQESYMVDAFSYLVKPPTPKSVRDVLNKLERVRNNTDTNSILLKISGIAKSVLFRDISHVEVIQHKVYFRLADGDEIEVTTTLAEVMPKLLSDARFVRCHRSYIVNMDNIAEITENEIVVRNGAKIPMSKNYREARNKFFKWMFGGDRE